MAEDTKLEVYPVLEELQLSQIVFDEGLYPRTQGHSPSKVQDYVRDIAIIEAARKFIAVNAKNILIDGRHRMLAYRKIHEQNPDVCVFVWRYPVESPLETLRLAAALQDRGFALTTEDRIDTAKKLYSFGLHSQQEIADALGVGQSTVSAWLSRTLKELKERQREKAFALWLSCHTQEQIADSVEVTHQTVSNWIEDFAKLSGVDNFAKLSREQNALASHATDFDPPLYNIWKQQTKTPGSSHFGNSEVRWLDNLLYLYTNPLDIVVDPFAGGGSTIDLCKKRFRRYWVSDRKPIVEREHEIRLWDLTDGLPPLPRWQDVKLVYLDPPYWIQAEGQYSHDATDLANMDLGTFTKTLVDVIHGFAKKLHPGAVIALLLQPTQWKAPERQYTDHIADMLRTVKLPLKMRYSCPYESQQCTAQMVEWAKANKQCLVLSREIVVWEIA